MMKSLIALLFTCSMAVWGRTEREFFKLESNGPKLTKTQFRSVIRILNNHFKSYAEKDGRVLEFYTDYDADWAQAFARRWETDQVHVYGGLAAVPNVTEDSFALVLCHELGHLYGGVPFGDAHNKMAVEGQADYWATLNCFRKAVTDLPSLQPSKSALQLCENDLSCARGLDAAKVMASFYADNRNLPHPSFETPDLSVVTEVLRTHPEPQCRLDTYRAGLFNERRPGCWMPRGSDYGRVPYTPINH